MTEIIEIPRRLAGVQYREARFEDVEDPEERLIVLRAVPYDLETRLAENLFESFEPAAFARAAKDPARVKLWSGHSTTGGSVVGQAVDIVDEAAGPLIRMRVSRTQAGEDLLTLARDGVLDEASVEFNPIRESMKVERRGSAIHVRHLRAHLRGVGLVPHGAYGRNALVASVRDDDEVEKAREAALAHLRSLNG